jgi:hypothetical protein
MVEWIAAMNRKLQNFYQLKSVGEIVNSGDLLLLNKN